MIKKIVALIAIAIALWAVFFMLNLDKEANKMQQIREIIQSTATQDKKLATTTPSATEQKVNISNSKTDNKIEQKIKALKEKAGNTAAFQISPLYKKHCASCHGNMAEGIIGPKLIGNSKEKILTALNDFKSGKRKNYVMYGLLVNLSQQQLINLAQEISTFQSKLNNAAK